jgi:hypothetical protein
MPVAVPRLPLSPLPALRGYQADLVQAALAQDSIVYLETGACVLGTQGTQTAGDSAGTGTGSEAQRSRQRSRRSDTSSYRLVCHDH